MRLLNVSNTKYENLNTERSLVEEIPLHDVSISSRIWYRWVGWFLSLVCLSLSRNTWVNLHGKL
jgi:hypothetical protein